MSQGFYRHGKGKGDKFQVKMRCEEFNMGALSGKKKKSNVCAQNILF